MATEIDLGVVKGEPADAEEVLALIEAQNLVDTEPVAESTKLVQSGGVFGAVESAKDDTLNESLDRYVISNSVENYEDLPTENLYDGLAYRVNSQGMYYAWRDDAWNIIDARQVINGSPQNDDLPMTSAAVMQAIEDAHTMYGDVNLSINADTADGYKVVNATQLVNKNILITRTNTSCNGVELNFDSEVSKGSHFDLVYRVPVGSEGLSTQLKITSGGIAVRTFPESTPKGVYTGLAFSVKAKSLGDEWQCDIAVITTSAGIISPNVATYKITFSGANRNSTQDLSYTQTAEAGTNVTLRDDILKSINTWGVSITRREWNTNADGSGTAYANNGVIANINSNLILYPVWNYAYKTGTWNAYSSSSFTGNKTLNVTKIFAPLYIEDYVEIKVTLSHRPRNNGTYSVSLYCNDNLAVTTNGGTADSTYTNTSGWIRVPRSGVVDGKGQFICNYRAVCSTSSDKKFANVAFHVSQIRLH